MDEKKELLEEFNVHLSRVVGKRIIRIESDPKEMKLFLSDNLVLIFNEEGVELGEVIPKGETIQ